jgi:Adenylate and Guanylate cyclase catalytic domain
MSFGTTSMNLSLAVSTIAVKAPTPLQTRVGIATGMVVIGDLIGSGEAQERGIVGETPNVAARLQSIAEPNMVVIAESTRKLLGNLFELEDRGPQKLKGIDGTMRAFVTLRPSMVESRFEALRIATTPRSARLLSAEGHPADAVIEMWRPNTDAWALRGHLDSVAATIIDGETASRLRQGHGATVARRRGHLLGRRGAF